MDKREIEQLIAQRKQVFRVCQFLIEDMNPNEDKQERLELMASQCAGQFFFFEEVQNASADMPELLGILRDRLSFMLGALTGTKQLSPLEATILMKLNTELLKCD